MKKPSGRVLGLFRTERNSTGDVRSSSANQTPESKSPSMRLSSASLHLRALLTSPRRRKPVQDETCSSPKTISPADSLESEQLTPEKMSEKAGANDVNVFTGDELSGLEIAYVDEESAVPEAPSAFDKRAFALLNAETRIRSLQNELDNLHCEREKREIDHRAEKLMLQKNLDSFKVQAETAKAEVADLTSQLKETRKRLSRRVRELEEELTGKNAELAAANIANKKTISQLRAECEILRAGYLDQDIPHGFVDDRVPKAKSAVRKESRMKPNGFDSSTRNFSNGTQRNSSASAGSSGSVDDQQRIEENTMAVDAPPVSSAMPPKSPRNSSVVESFRSPTRPPSAGHSRPTSPSTTDLVRSSTSPRIAPTSPRAYALPRSLTSPRGLPSHSSDFRGRGSLDNGSDFMEGGRRRSAGHITDGRRRRQGTQVGHDPSSVESRCKARRISLRKSFIAHIHSNRYRNMRIVWYDFLRAPGSHLTRDQFLSAVRKMPFTSQPKDQDIDLIRDEICGHSRRDEVMTWTMFVRFYQRTKNEC